MTSSDIIIEPNQLNTMSKGYFCLYGIAVLSASLREFDKMQIPFEMMQLVLAVSVGLATIGICVFVRLFR